MTLPLGSNVKTHPHHDPPSVKLHGKGGFVAGGGSQPPLVNSYLGNTVDGTGFYQNSIWPNAVYDSATKKTWCCWEGRNGVYRIINVRVYNNLTGSWSNIYQAAIDALVDDSHGNPAIIKDADGYWHIFYGGHASNIQHSVTASQNDPSVWTIQPFVNNGTYTRPLLVNGQIWLFYRGFDPFGLSSLSTFQVSKSTSVVNGVVTWSSPEFLVDLQDGSHAGRYDGGRLFIRGGTIYTIATRPTQNDTLRRGLYNFQIDIATGDISNLDNSVTVAKASLPVNLTQANASFLIADAAFNNNAQLCIPDHVFDISGTRHFLHWFSSDQVTYMLNYYSATSGVMSGATTLVTQSNGFFSAWNAFTATPDGAVQAWWTSYPKNSAGDDPTGGPPIGLYYANKPLSGSFGAFQLLMASDPLFPLGPCGAVHNTVAYNSDVRLLFCQAPWNELAAPGNGKIYLFGDRGLVGASSFISPWPPSTLPPVDTLNASDKTDANIVVSTDGLSAYSSNGDSSKQVRSINSYGNNKVHVEFVILCQKATNHGGRMAIGLALTSHPITTAHTLGEDLLSCGLRDSGAFVINGLASQLGANVGLQINTSDIVAMEADFIAGRIWYKNVTRNSLWNNNAAADPATGVGGLDFSGIFVNGTTLHLCLEIDLQSNAIALNVGELPYAMTPSSGFLNWR